MPISRTALTALAMTTALIAGAATADGQYAMRDQHGDFMGDLIIVGDVYAPNGQPFVLLEMIDQNMWFYFPPEAIYIELHESNPILYNQTPFYGEWVDTSNYAQGCNNGSAADHNGQQHALHGGASIANAAFPVYDPNSGTEYTDFSFDIWVDYCGGTEEFFAFYEPEPLYQNGGGYQNNNGSFQNNNGSFQNNNGSFQNNNGSFQNGINIITK